MLIEGFTTNFDSENVNTVNSAIFCMFNTIFFCFVYNIIVMGMASAVTHVTVMRGERLTLKCEKKPGHMDWKNQDNIVLFFNNIQGGIQIQDTI